MMSRSLLNAFLLSVVALGAGAAAQGNDPVADPKAVLKVGNARFTVLTPALIRMEWSPGGVFEDRPSLVFINRRLPVPSFTTSSRDGWFVLKTEALTLKYKENSGRFGPLNLSVEFVLDNKSIVWRPGIPDTGNLRGTTRTLDGVEGSTPLEPGLLSRDGWVVVNDSSRSLFDNSDWPWVTVRDGGNQDLYFFGYGHNYRRALRDFTRVAGPIPMPPRFAFGAWWSRYWAYTDSELKDLVRQFQSFQVPLDVLVIDMDWHRTFDLRWEGQKKDQAGQPLGWTGYTWDTTYFPDPSGFLQWCDRQGLKETLNLHPASGIQPFEAAYPSMARAMGIDPATKRYVPFDITNKNFARNYMDLVIHPLEGQGVDFWWLDWQQWSTTKIPGVTPTWWLNYVFFTDMQRQGKNRPLLFHRWGGLGNHRYQVGFSGDAISTWPTLAFETYFTATAANVCYGYWSHDIGGHLPGPVSPEMYTRWVQFGIFSPVFRTHTTKNPDAERRIWAYPTENFLAMRDAFKLRYAMVPYIYTAARQAYETGVSICHPVYYDYPDSGNAYRFSDEYMFGDDVLVSPVAVPIFSDIRRAPVTLWLPPGEWTEWFTGAHLRGPAVITREFALDQIPVYIRGGSIIPMAPDMRTTHEKPVDPLILLIVPGDSGSARLYQDEGNSEGYRKDECAWTRMSYQKNADGTLRIEIGPAEGTYPGMPGARRYEIRLQGFWPPRSVASDGMQIPYAPDDSATGWEFKGNRLMTVIRLPEHDVRSRVTVDVHPRYGPGPDDSLLDGVSGTLERLKQTMALVNSGWPKEWSPDILVHAFQTGERLSLHPERAREELSALKSAIPEIVRQIGNLNLPQEKKKSAEKILEENSKQ